jgi:hypothetical protein
MFFSTEIVCGPPGEPPRTTFCETLFVCFIGNLFNGTFSVTKTMRQMKGWMNDELEWMWKEAVVI